MDDLRFDRLTRSFATSRRRALAAFAGALVGAAGLDAAPASAARGTCRAIWASCTRDQQCCTGTCAAGRSYPRAIRNRCVCLPNCGGGKCDISDGCGNFCPSCDDGWVCSEENICEAACAGTTGICFLSAEGVQYENPASCGSNSRIHDGCETDADCEATSDWINNYSSAHGGNIEVVCTRVLYYNGNQLETKPEGACYVKPLATGACWS